MIRWKMFPSEAPKSRRWGGQYWSWQGQRAIACPGCIVQPAPGIPPVDKRFANMAELIAAIWKLSERSFSTARLPSKASRPDRKSVV